MKTTRNEMSEDSRQLNMLAAATPSATSNNPPITILNFTYYIGQILNAVIANQANWKVITDNQNTSQQNELSITNILRDQTAAIAGLSGQVAVLNTNIVNVVSLMQAIIDGLGGVATSDVQQQEVALLAKIVQFIDQTGPIALGLDLSNSTVEAQATPPRSGP